MNERPNVDYPSWTWWEKVKGVPKPLYEDGLGDFEFDHSLFDSLTLRAIDDVDVEWHLRQQQRIEGQYRNGLQGFLMQYGGHLLLFMVGLLILVGYVIYLKEVPSVSQQCISGGVEAAKNTYLRELATKAGVQNPDATTATQPPPG